MINLSASQRPGYLNMTQPQPMCMFSSPGGIRTQTAGVQDEHANHCALPPSCISKIGNNIFTLYTHLEGQLTAERATKYEKLECQGLKYYNAPIQQENNSFFMLKNFSPGIEGYITWMPRAFKNVNQPLNV